MLQETPTTAPPGDLAAENTALKAKLAEIEAAKKQADADEVVIAKMMAKGLRREQAAAVLQRQREYDAQKERRKAEGTRPKIATPIPIPTPTHNS
jgi:regulator of protease activity HflC (stomatin/prohibitin superfamily)